MSGTAHARVEAHAWCPPIFLSTLCFEAGPLTASEAHQISAAGWPMNSKVLPLWESPALESGCLLPHPAFHMNSGNLNLGPDTYPASALPSGPSPQHFYSAFYFGRSNQAIPCRFLLGRRRQQRDNEKYPRHHPCLRVLDKCCSVCINVNSGLA